MVDWAKKSNEPQRKKNETKANTPQNEAIVRTPAHLIAAFESASASVKRQK